MRFFVVALAMLLGLLVVARAEALEHEADTVQVDLRVWQSVSDPLRVYLSARPAGGKWGRTERLPMGGTNDRETFRYSDRTVAVAIADGPADVNLRVWQSVSDPPRLYIQARASGGEWGRAERVQMDETNDRGTFRYRDLTVAVPRLTVREQCESGEAVPEPVANAELVADCATLLGLRDTLRGSVPLNWSAGLAMTSWEGVTVTGTPPRVTALSLASRGLTGRLPAALGDLTALTRLDLSQNLLEGSIPAELGSLEELQALRLYENHLSGSIPMELTRLHALTALFLAENTFGDCIPLRLRAVASNDLDRYSNLDCTPWEECRSGVPVPDPAANPELLEDCEALLVWRDTLAGTATLNWSVGRAMSSWTGVAIAGTPRRVTKLELANHGLTGEISGLVGDLEGLAELRLNGNALTGRIPSKVTQLSRLEHVYLAGNALSNCVPQWLRGVANHDLAVLSLPDCGEPLDISYGDPVLTAGTYQATWEEGGAPLVFDVPSGLQLEVDRWVLGAAGEIELLLRVVNSEASIGLHVYQGVERGRARPAAHADRLDPLFDRLVESAWVDSEYRAVVPVPTVTVVSGGESTSGGRAAWEASTSAEGNVDAAVEVVLWERDSSYFISTRTPGRPWVTHNQELSRIDSGDREESSRVHFAAPSYSYRDASGSLYLRGGLQEPHVRLTRMTDGGIQADVCIFSSPTSTHYWQCSRLWSDSGHHIRLDDFPIGGWKRSEAIAVRYWIPLSRMDREPERYIIYGDAPDEVLATVESRLVAVMEWMDEEYDLTPGALVWAGATHDSRGCGRGGMWFSANKEPCYHPVIVAHEYVHALENALHPGCYTGTCWWGDAPREDTLPKWLQNVYRARTDGYGTVYENLTEGWAIEGVAMYFQFRYGQFLHGRSGDDCDFARQRLDDIYESGRDHGPHRLGHGLVCELLDITGVPPATLLAAGTFEELFGLTPDDFYERVQERIQARTGAQDE